MKPHVFLRTVQLKIFSVLFLMMLNLSCTALMNPQEQPVNLIDEKANIYITTCSGTAETMGTCHQKAKRTCKNGYEMLNENLSGGSIGGVTPKP